MAPFIWTKCPACTEGRAQETRHRIQEIQKRVFYWFQNGEEEDASEEDSPYVFFCEDCEEDLDNWGGSPPAGTKQKPKSCTTCIDGQEEEDRCRIERSRQRLNSGPWNESEEPERYVQFVCETCRAKRNGEKEEPEPKRSRREEADLANLDAAIQSGPSNQQTEE